MLDALTVTAGGAVLSTHAVYNGFPLVYPDTGTYVAACLDRFIPRDRPLTYSFFLRHFSLQETLWLPMIAQCLLISWLVLLLFRHFTAVQKPWTWHFATIVILTFTTGLAANTDLLIPDIFTSVLLLSGALLLFAERLNRPLRIFLLLLFAFSMTTHLSHYPLACAMAGTVFIVWFFRRKKENSRRLLVRTLQIGLMVPVAIVMTLLINYQVGHKWQFNPGSGHVFMMNRLLQCGILTQYLEENCPVRPTTMCEYRPSMQQDFLWDPHSPLNEHYGWEGWENAKPEYDSIISEIFSTPKYFWQYVRADISDAATQLVTFRVTTMRQLLAGQAVHDVIQHHYPEDHVQYLQSKQAAGKLQYDVIDTIQVVFCTLTFAALVLLLAVRKFRVRMPSLLPLSLWIFAGMIFNALTVVSVAMVDSRYQSRLIWIIPLLVCCYVAHAAAGKRSSGTENLRS